MAVTADDEADCLVAARLSRGSDVQLLHAGLKKKTPARHHIRVLVEQSQAVYAAVARHFFGAHRSDTQNERLACPYLNRRRRLLSLPIAAVLIRRQLDH